MTDKRGYASVEELGPLVKGVYRAFHTGTSRNVNWRRNQIRALAYMIKDNEDRLYDAVFRDLGRSKNETYFAEMASMMTEIIETEHTFVKWTKPERVNAGAQFIPVKPTIYKEPKGPALIIGTWNYPMSLVILPLLGAIAAGCPAVLKLSEHAPATAQVLADIVPQYLDNENYKVVLGEGNVAGRLLEETWGHVFYTGGDKVARIVATAAAKTLSPVTLELGGKSPVIIDPDLQNVEIAARRILWAKRYNAGQICIAPDHIIVPRSKQDAIAAAISKQAKSFFTTPQLKDDVYSRIITHAQWDRLDSALSKTKGTKVLAGDRDRQSKLFGINVVKDVSYDDELMRAELFGPILPIVPVDDVDEAIRKLQDQTPLAIYVFSNNQAFIDKVRTSTRSGAIVINDLMLHNTISALPFGGTGESGQGAYHGKRSFDTFTHERASISVPFWAEAIYNMRYYPHTDSKTNILKRLNPKISFPRPAAGSKEAFESSKAVSRLIKLTLAAAAVFILTTRYSWVLNLVPRYKLVRVD